MIAIFYGYVKWSLEGENTAGLEVLPLVKALPPHIPCPVSRYFHE
jgi:hypothetical protein